MTDNNEQVAQQKDADLNKSDDKKSSNAPHPAQSKKAIKVGTTSSSNKLASLAIGLSGIALLSSAWLYYQSTNNQQSYHEITTQLGTLSQQQDTLNARVNKQGNQQVQLNAITKEIKSLQQDSQNTTAEFTLAQTNQAEKIQQLEAKLNRLNNTTKEDWKLAEAEYLVRLANQRLLLESDSAGAEALLSNADNILKELEDPIFFSARKAIAKDIQSLKAVSQFDLEGHYLQLDALYELIPQLPQREPSKAWQESAKQTEQAQQESIEQANVFASTLEKLWLSIRSLVVINYQHKPIEALLPPAEYQQLITGLQLQVDVAQVALVKGESNIYQQALARVAGAITEHFDTDSQRVTTFLASLTALQQINPNPDLPLPRDSLLAMQSLMSEWKQRSSVQNTEANSEAPAQTPALDKEPSNAPEDTASSATAAPTQVPNPPQEEPTTSNTPPEQSDSTTLNTEVTGEQV
ncbi:uroporphyrinogen-III C-methyltransferase [Marinomonas dokdonensis]|uniref:uroporphyrinogen-III C-methyltransferase n=1 Tax=Marinomonas dokdonensis TaxID=328224 RepID=UPI0040554360